MGHKIKLVNYSVKPLFLIVLLNFILLLFRFKVLADSSILLLCSVGFQQFLSLWAFHIFFFHPEGWDIVVILLSIIIRSFWRFCCMLFLFLFLKFSLLDILEKNMGSFFLCIHIGLPVFCHGFSCYSWQSHIFHFLFENKGLGIHAAFLNSS